MNKEISVQYAYKKDGKGERHGDQAERMLAAQAKAHGVEPTSATIPTGIAPQANFAGMPAQPNIPQGMAMPAGFGQQNGNYQNVPPPSQARPPPPPMMPLSAPATGLPARPPTQNAGYGGPPQGFAPPGFAPPGFQQPPQGFNQSQMYPGQNQAMAPPGGPPALPPGFSNFGVRK